ncbi:hypothetical protein FHP05_12120 [Cerasibacillus terrae]|uniref:Uncharacterized protein n=1 Tax=Cerasibacillus terrae TaxID=2498845 RepID=A0A5C8NNR7_9BACI|nr:hypothetical protein [Cerasibacillus terrae]TXL62545.1 hypothetical protein FHP05_12120 [Cerasibacillus terrae]
MFTEEIYNELSVEVYRVDQSHKSYDIDLNEGEVREIGNFNYKILKVEDNTTNGMQAMAVAPVKNEKVDTSEVVIAFPGINLYSLLST